MNTLIAMGCLKAYLKWTTGWCAQAGKQVGKTAVIVGATKHPGYEVAEELADRGCRVIIADYDNLDITRDKIIARTTNGQVDYRFVNLYNFNSVHKLAENIRATVPDLSTLIFTDHVSGMDKTPTVDGFSKVLQYNHLSPFLLTYLLKDVLKKNPGSRVIFRSNTVAFFHRIKSPADIHKTSMSHIQVVDDFFQYANTSALTLMTMACFADELKDYNVFCCAAHPGFMNMSLFDISKLNEEKDFQMLLSLVFGKFVPLFLQLFGKNNLEAAQTAIFAAVSPAERDISGKLFSNCHFIMQPPSTQILEFAYLIYEETKRLVLNEDSKRREKEAIAGIPKRIIIKPDVLPSEKSIELAPTIPLPPTKADGASCQVPPQVKSSNK